jgi:hypothetical protein
MPHNIYICVSFSIKMEKDIDRIPKNLDTDIVIRVDDFGGKRGVTIREFVKSERYSGFTKSGTKIPADKFGQFKAAINAIDEKVLAEPADASPAPTSSPAAKPASSAAQPQKKPANKQIDSIEEQEF